jgi:hypothetical protein
MGCSGAKLDAQRPPDFAFVLQNTPRRLAEFRGKPTILILMRTSEMVSQIYMARLKDAYAALKERCQVLVLSVEPTEAPFVDVYIEAESLPFPIGIAEENVLLGSSVLGLVPFIPYTYFIDVSGSIVKSVPGVIETGDLRTAADRFFDR